MVVSSSQLTPVEHYYAVLVYHVYLATLISFPKELKYVVCQSILIVILVASGSVNYNVCMPGSRRVQR